MISVIYHGCSLQPQSAARKLPQLPEQYLLFVGERGRYKNFPFTLRALAPLLLGNSGLNMVCAGGGAFTGEEHAMLDGLGLHGRCRQFSLDDTELAAAYSGAVTLVFPSLSEGFGMPVLEAFACGCPALLSSRTSLPEVGGEAVLYFDPENMEELRTQAERLLVDASLRAGLIAKGLARVREFTWERTAAATRDVYAKVLHSWGENRGN
jgi:glycosyltransferase involved in cell wall biosynthesis